MEHYIYNDILEIKIKVSIVNDEKKILIGEKVKSIYYAIDIGKRTMIRKGRLYKNPFMQSKHAEIVLKKCINKIKIIDC